LKDIEVLADERGAPVVKLHGDAKNAAEKAGVKSVSVSISHSEDQAVAIAVAQL
jgi:fatty acid synthase subunit alpha